MLDDCFHRNILDADDFVTRGATSDEFDLAASAVQPFGEEMKERFVGGIVYWRSGQSDAQFVPKGAKNGVPRGTRLDLEGEQDLARLSGEVAW